MNCHPTTLCPKARKRTSQQKRLLGSDTTTPEVSEIERRDLGTHRQGSRGDVIGKLRKPGG